MTEAMYDPLDKPTERRVPLASLKPETVTITGYEANVNRQGQSVLRMICHPLGKPTFTEAIIVSSDHLSKLMTAEQYAALPKQTMQSCDIDIELTRIQGFSMNPYRISKLIRGEIVAKETVKTESAVTLTTADELMQPAPVLPVDDKPQCLNDWALDLTKRAAFQARVDDMAFEAMIDSKKSRPWALAILGVSDETQIATTASEALKTIKATLPKPEPKPAPYADPVTGEIPIKANDADTGEPIDAAIIPYEPVRAAVERVKTSVAILQGVRPMLIKDVDFGVIPGTGTKPVLLKPGAEKLVNAFNLCPEFEIADTVKQWDGDKPLFYFQYRCKLVDISTGRTVATGLGSCNSMESKYRWRWLWKNQLDDQGINPEGLITRKTQKGSIQYRVPNDDIFSQINTLDKMAQKRALIAAVLIGCNASRDFTQDIEDSDYNAN